MKEKYTSLELELIGLTAEERLANEGDELLGTPGGKNPVNPSETDIDVPLIGLDLSL